MLNKKSYQSSPNDSGVTLLELLVALVLTSMLALGITKVLGMSVAAIGYSQANTITGSNTAGLDATFSQDVAASNGFTVPFSDTNDLITSAIGNSFAVTYTFSGQNTFIAGQTVSISGLTPSDLNVSNAMIASVPTPTTFTIAKTTIGSSSTIGTVVAMPDATQLCTTWSSGDMGMSNVRPLITFSRQSSYTLTAVSGDGTSATYTVSGQHRLVPLQSVTVAGVTPSSFNVTNAVVTSVPTATTFTVANTTINSITTNGAVAVNTYIGYDIRTGETSLGQIWRVKCLLPGMTKTGADSVLLRSGLPVSSSSTDWLSSIQCSTFSNSLVSNTACPVNQFLNSYTLYPGITFVVPATIASTPAHIGQVVLGTRGLS